MTRPGPKPCPFCGSPAELVEESDHHGGYFKLGCPQQECPGHWAFYTEPIEDLAAALSKWNTRAGESPGATVTEAKGWPDGIPPDCGPYHSLPGQLGPG